MAWRGGEARPGQVVLEALRGPFLESWQRLLRAELSLHARLKGQWGAKESFGVGMLEDEGAVPGSLPGLRVPAHFHSPVHGSAHAVSDLQP